ncbi:UDP-3-O-acyl-N-acetylglucosamine deacetylase [Inquilinus sp. CAU 1745]|uniref:UDP-3-O-acyl-N-acetylglucosamine deacetylase n=1 Tax=Inquilinus sp. CAU 1745 TaxID=3140369 RepID=UPI00325AC786
MSFPTVTSEGSSQKTLKSAIHCSGVGLHSGRNVSMTLRPADVNTGITFIRTDLKAGMRVIPAIWDRVVDTRLCTVVGNEDGATVGTIEHLMAALRGCGVDNAEIELDGPEVPVMDGSAAPFVFLIECAGMTSQAAARRAIRLLRPVEVSDGDKLASFTPSVGCSYSMLIDFPSRAISRQQGYVKLENGSFKDEISRARTFGFLQDVEMLKRNGLALGGSLDNAVVVNGDKVLNEDGLRFQDEFVRHKILDSIGDLYLAGAPVLGHFHGVKSGHALNNKLLRELFADESAWIYDTMGAVETLPTWEAAPLARTA